MSILPRTLFREEHHAFRDTARRFIEREVVPYYSSWEDEGKIPREVWRQAGEVGLLCPDVPEQYGGAGGDFVFNAIVHEEMASAGAASFSACLIAHSDIVTSYLITLGTEEQKRRWLPGMVGGAVIAAIGMSEPGAGSDLKALRTSARRHDDHFLLNGQKTFITNAQNADLVVVAAKTNPDDVKAGISLFTVDTSLPGFRRGRLLEKVGQKAGDTGELFFDDVKLSLDTLLGAENRGFRHMMELMPRERIAIAMSAVAEAESALDWTIEYVKRREAFGQPLAQLQTIRFKIAELASKIAVARVFVDHCLEKSLQDALDLRTAVIAKYWVTDVSYSSIDECLQLFGGYGYMREYPISRAWVDSRIHRIYGGANEIMQDIIGKGLLS